MTAPGACFASADEAMDMARAALGYLAGADAAALPTVTQARLLRELERAQSQHTAARTRVLAAFTAQSGFADDACASPRSWLAWQTRVTIGTASAAIGWTYRLAAHPRVAQALAAGLVSQSYAQQICKWSDKLPPEDRDASDRILLEAAARGTALADLADLAEDIFARVAPPDTDPDEDARFRDRWFRVTRLFQGGGRPDGDLTPECLAAVQEVLDTLGKKHGPEDDRTLDQRRHDALEEAMRLLLASGCLPERAGQPAQVQLHTTLDELLGMPGGPDAATAWLARLLADGQPDAGPAPDAGPDPDSAADPASSGHGAPGWPGASDPASSRPGDAGQLGPGAADWPAPSAPGQPDPGTPGQPGWPGSPAARRRAAGAGETGWLRGKAAEAYSCDARIAPMTCGHLDRNLLARLVATLIHGTPADGSLTNLAADSGPVRGPRCLCDQHPAPRTPAAASPGSGRLTPDGLAMVRDTLLRCATSLLSGPTGLAAYLRTQLTGGLFPSPSLPLDLGQPTEQVPPHLRRAVIRRDRHCAFPGCNAAAVRCQVHHLIPRSKGGPTRLDNLTLLCHFHHLVAVHRWGWTLTLHGDGTTTAVSPDGANVLHSHSPPAGGQDTLWSDPPAGTPPAGTSPAGTPPATAA